MVQYIDIRGKINSQGLKQNGVSKVELSESLDKVVDKLKTRLEREMPDTGFFRSFAENFDKDVKPQFYGKDISLFVQRDNKRDGRAYLGISVLHPQLCLDATSYLMNGTRENILEYISNPEFNDELTKMVLDLSESLKKQG